jgi:hypothetical protein
MATALGRIGRDLRRRRHLDAYVVAAVALVLAVLSLVGDVVGEGLRWAAVLAALSLLVYRITLPDAVGNLDAVLQDRSAFEDTTFASRLKPASVVWVFAPSAANLLTASAVDDLRRTVLVRPDGLVRVVVLDPAATAAVELAARQLDDTIDYPVQVLAEALATMEARLRSIAQWSTAGRFEHRYAAFNPGFSLVAIDPHAKHGVVIVEFHGFHNESTGSRMHIELRRRGSEHWFDYWADQFEHIWRSARAPAAGTGQPTGSPRPSG